MPGNPLFSLTAGKAVRYRVAQPQEDPMRRTLSLCLLVVSCVLSVAEAGQANRCRRACRAAVDDCVATTHPVRDYTGAWTFVGTLAEDSCGAGPGLAETFVISQSGTALEVTVESLPGVTLGGQVTDEGFQASGTFVGHLSPKRHAR